MVGPSASARIFIRLKSDMWEGGSRVYSEIICDWALERNFSQGYALWYLLHCILLTTDIVVGRSDGRCI
jgi:hypothetical protein